MGMSRKQFCIRRHVLFRRQKGLCAACKCPMRMLFGQITLSPDIATLQHIIPKALGGTNRWENLELMCHGCNQKDANTIARIAEAVAVLESGNYIPPAEGVV